MHDNRKTCIIGKSSRQSQVLYVFVINLISITINANSSIMHEITTILPKICKLCIYLYYLVNM